MFHVIQQFLDWYTISEDVRVIIFISAIDVRIFLATSSNLFEIIPTKISSLMSSGCNSRFHHSGNCWIATSIFNTPWGKKRSNRNCAVWGLDHPWLHFMMSHTSCSMPSLSPQATTTTRTCSSTSTTPP